MTKRVKPYLVAFCMIYTVLYGAWSLFAAASATPIKYPQKEYNAYATMEAQAVPASPTVIIKGPAIFGGGWISCTGTQTITLTDGNSASWLPVIAWAGPQATSLNLFAGAYVSGNLSITASATGCIYSVWWRQ